MDERLRELERRWGASGAAEDRSRYYAELARSRGGMWGLFLSFFHVVQERPWVQEHVRQLRDICEVIAADPSFHGKGKERFVHYKGVIPGEHTNGAKVGIVARGTFFGDTCFNDVEKVVVLGGLFNTRVNFGKARDIIVFDGVFERPCFQKARRVTIFGGKFDCQLSFSGVSDAIIFAGTFAGMENFINARDVTILGGDFSRFHGFHRVTRLRFWVDCDLNSISETSECVVVARRITTLHGSSQDCEFFVRSCEGDHDVPLLKVDAIPSPFTYLKGRVTRESLPGVFQAAVEDLGGKAKPCPASINYAQFDLHDEARARGLGVGPEHLDEVAGWFASELEAWGDDHYGFALGGTVVDRIEELVDFLAQKAGLDDGQAQEFVHSNVQCQDRSTFKPDGYGEGHYDGSIELLGHEVVQYGCMHDGYAFSLEVLQKELRTALAVILQLLAQH